MLGSFLLVKTNLIRFFFNSRVLYYEEVYKRRNWQRSSKVALYFYRGDCQVHKRENNIPAPEFWRKIINKYPVMVKVSGKRLKLTNFWKCNRRSCRTFCTCWRTCTCSSCFGRLKHTFFLSFSFYQLYNSIAGRSSAIIGV